MTENTVQETVYIGRDNLFSLEVLEDNVAVDLVAGGVTRVDLDIEGKITIDSDTYPSAFDYATDGASGIIHFDFGGLTLPLGKDFNTTLIIYDSAHTDGQIWDTFDLTIDGDFQ